MFSCFNTTGCEAYSFTTDGYGIFSVLTNLRACRTHEGEGGGSGGEGGRGGGSDTNKSAQELIQRDIKTVSHSASPCVGSNPGSSDYNSDALTTELRPT